MSAAPDENPSGLASRGRMPRGIRRLIDQLCSALTRIAQEALAARLASMRALDASDIAATVVYAVMQPPHVNVYELLVRPTEQV